MRSVFSSEFKRGIAVLLILLGLSACQECGLPEEMVDTWITDHPQYADCYLLMSRDEVVFGGADATRHAHIIHKVRTQRQEGRVDVAIQTIDDQQADTCLDLVYLPDENNGLLHFKHQPHVIWYRHPTLYHF